MIDDHHAVLYGIVPDEGIAAYLLDLENMVCLD